MKRIKAALARLAEKLETNRAKLKFAYRRWRVNHKKAKAYHERALRTERAADRARANDRPRVARKQDRLAIRHHVKAGKFQARAQYWIARIKEAKRKIEHLEESQQAKEAALAKWLKHHEVRINGDTITGGNARERLVAGALAAVAGCSAGRRRNVYSQPGRYTVAHGITGEPSGYRSDCSQWVTSIYHSAGLRDPNAAKWQSGYTGTLVANGTQVSRANAKPGDLVIYGSGSGYHVEMLIGPGDRTAGHGSAPVDFGTVDLFGEGPSSYRIFSYI